MAGVPLKLSGKEQEFFADLCSHLRSVRYQYEIGKPMTGDEIADRLYDILDRYDLSPQDLDHLYDRMHRTGANFR